MSKFEQACRSIRDMVLPEPVFDFWCEELGLIHRRTQMVAKAVKIINEAPNAVSIWLKPNRNFTGVRAGQHINIGVEINGRLVSRSYSVSRVKGRLFRITARQVENGKVSSYLNHSFKKGMRIVLGDVYGEVTVDSFHKSPALFLAGGIGITPIISMVESWSSSFRERPVQLVYWGKRAQDLAFVNRLRALSKQHSWFEFKILETEFLERNPDGSPKLLTETTAWFQELRERLSSFDAFACGSDGFVEQVREKLAPLVNQFHFESFSPLAVASVAGAPVQVTLTRQNRSVSIPSGVNLLQALEKAGVAVSSGCRRGTCNTCSCKKVSGVAQHQKDQTIHASTDAGFKPCTHAAMSDMTLEL